MDNRRNFKYPFAFKMQSKFSEGITWGFWPPQNCQKIKDEYRGWSNWFIGDHAYRTPNNDYGNSPNCRLSFNFLYTYKREDMSDGFFSLMCQYVGEDWLFLNRLVFNIDNSELLELEIHKGRTEVGVDLYSHGIYKTRTVGSRSVPVNGVLEQGNILLSIEQLKKLADAKTVDLRVSGKDGHIDQELSLGYGKDTDGSGKKIHYNEGWDLDNMSDVKKDDSWSDIGSKNHLFGSVFTKGGQNPFIFSSQCMYYCFVGKESHAEQMAPLFRCVKKFQYLYYPDEDPTEKVGEVYKFLIKDRKGTLNVKQWKTHDDLIELVEKQKKETQEIEEIQEVWFSLSKQIIDLNDQLQQAIADNGQFKDAVGRSAYELVKLGTKEPEFESLSEIHSELTLLNGNTIELEKVDGILKKAKAMAEIVIVKAKIKLLEMKLEKAFIKTGEGILNSNKINELIESSTLKEKINENRIRISEIENEIKAEESSLQSKKEKLCEKLGVDSLPNEGPVEMLQEAKSKVSLTEGKLEQWKEDTIIEMIEAGESKWPKKGPLRDFLSNL